MTNTTQAQKRLITSARLLRAYFEHKFTVSIELLTEAPSEPNPTDIPFTGVPEDYGLWGLRAGQELNAEQKVEVSEMCASILGGLERLEKKRAALEDLQTQMETVLEGESISNVIAFQRRPRTGLTVASDKKYILKLDCLIEGQSVEEIHRMAMELHSQSQRLIFLNYLELSDRQRGSITHLLELGPIHLFVPAVHELNALEQEMLRHLVLQDTLSRPLVMAGTTVSYSELLTAENIDRDLLTQLARAYIKLTRPFSEYKQQGLIHYFLDTLSSSPT